MAKFDSEWSAHVWGAKGGESRSAAKVKAARANGRKGGRPQTNYQTLIEKILNRRRMTDAEWRHLYREVLSRHMLIRDMSLIEDYFEVHSLSLIPHRWPRRIPFHVRQAIRHLKAVVTIYAPAKRA